MGRSWLKYFAFVPAFLSLIGLTLNPLPAQNKYGAAWIVGYSNDSTFYPKYGKTEINFSGGKIDVQYKFGEKLPELGFTNASIAHDDGTLRYFTDGFRIYNGKQKVVQNGDSINYGRIWENYMPIYPTSYNHYFIPMPGREKVQTILFHYTIHYHQNFLDRYFYVPEFKFSLIEYDPTINNSILSIKDSVISHGDYINRHMALTKHANGRDWWIIIEDYLTNNHRIYLLDTSGIRLFSTQELGVEADSFDWTGNSLFTPNGEMFIKYLRGYQIQVFDFDRCQGTLSNPRTVVNEKALYKDACFSSVSPNNRFLYLISDSTIWQYDLLASDIKGSETVVGEWDGFYFENRLTTAFNQSSLAMDGKIYVSCRSSSIYLHVINNPNEKGAGCNFELRQVELPAFMFGNLPTPPNYNLLSKKGSACDTLVLNSVVNSIRGDEIGLYPNPIGTYFRIASEFQSGYAVRLVDMVGNTLRDYQGNDPNYYDLSGIPPGVYMVHINGNGRSVIRKIVVGE